MTCLKSYDLNGKKLSFANWISNLSPQETPFVSMTGKESIQNTLFQWQTDALSSAGQNAVKEGEDAVEGVLRSTTVKSNVTQILRKVVKVSDTANALANYGRGQELQYQMEKAGKELKRDLEFAFLNNGGAVQESGVIPRETAGFHALVAPFGTKCPETGAIVHTKTAAANTLTEKDVFDLTYNLYLSGSSADIIMFHPKHASMFSGLQEKANTRMRIFEDTPKFSVYVSSLVDPLGQNYKLLPNRWMPEDKIYFFNASDWTQMVLRSPQRTKLAKDGSYEKWMIEMETGLRLRHPFAAGVLEIQSADKSHDKTNFLDGTNNTVKFTIGTTEGDDLVAGASAKSAKVGEALSVKFKTGTITGAAGVLNSKGKVSILKDGNEVWGEEFGATAVDKSGTALVVIPALSMADAGIYTLQVMNQFGATFQTQGLSLTVTRDLADSGDSGIVTPPVRGRAKKEAK